VKKIATTMAILALLTAATPALAGGWYLMAPKHNDQQVEPYIEAPLSDWQIEEAFDTAQGCEESLHHAAETMSHVTDKELEQVMREVRASSSNSEHLPFSLQQVRKIYADSQCVSTDDPRLAR
jgi:hypothetical protein